VGETLLVQVENGDHSLSITLSGLHLTFSTLLVQVENGEHRFTLCRHKGFVYMKRLGMHSWMGPI
jgi:hypothetical protein